MLALPDGNRVAAAAQRGVRELRPLTLRRDPSLGLVEERVHLGEQGPSRRMLALERLDAPESSEDRSSFVHAAEASGEIRTRV